MKLVRAVSYFLAFGLHIVLQNLQDCLRIVHKVGSDWVLRRGEARSLKGSSSATVSILVRLRGVVSPVQWGRNAAPPLAVCWETDSSVLTCTVSDWRVFNVLAVDFRRLLGALSWLILGCVY